MHLVITDSGLGGLAVCAAAEKALRRTGGLDVRITYFNAWPEQESGYNDMPDVEVRAHVFDRALSAMAALGADRIVIACNTLSVVHGWTTFSRTSAVPVLGIIDAGVDLFVEALVADPHASIILFGTKTTIESGGHRARLIGQGIAAERIAAVPCHGLARAIESDPDGGAVHEHIDRCTRIAAETPPSGDRLYFGVCCTHYTYVREEMRGLLQHRTGRPVQTLDPNDRLVAEVVREVGRAESPAVQTPGSPIAPEDLRISGSSDFSNPSVSVRVLSKVEMDDRKRHTMARRIEAVSPATAAALLAYTRVPALF